MIAATGKAEVSGGRETLPTVDRFSYPHLCAVDAVASAEENNDVAVEEISLGIEYQGGIGAKVDAVGAFGRRERRIGTAPARAAVEGGVCAHGKTEDLVRSPSKVLRLAGVHRNVSLALRSALVGDVHVRAYRHGIARSSVPVCGMR